VRRSLPRDLSALEIEALFTFYDAERHGIEERRSPALKLALALQIGFLRMTGRLLEAVRPALIGRIAPARTEGLNLRGVLRRRARLHRSAGRLSPPSLYGSATL
jgi:hypothetical protein